MDGACLFKVHSIGRHGYGDLGLNRFRKEGIIDIDEKIIFKHN
ncbi:MAG: hypothetical protein PWP45_1728 [Tepidanaerobacteraceae bacterium]|nr:hypothetical protein [Tepidanaerobacteraceae bacterium]